MDRQTETIIGSISGVRPTATAIRKEKRVVPVVLGQAVDEENQRHHHQHETDHQPGVFLDPAVETRFHLLAGEAAGHLAEISLRAGRNHDRRGRAALHARAKKTDVAVFKMAYALARVRPRSVFSTGNDSPVSVA